MTMNRVQFQPGLSMAEFMSRYGSDEQCEAALVESRWPTEFVCPACGCGHSSSFRREGQPKASASIRPRMSFPPPGGQGMTIFTGLEGEGCAMASVETSAANKAARICFIARAPAG